MIIKDYTFNYTYLKWEMLKRLLDKLNLIGRIVKEDLYWVKIIKE